METKFKITIPKPCHEDWNTMTPTETGRFCSVCTKGVVDFTNKSTAEIQSYLFQNQEQKICGRFRNEQIKKFEIQIPQSVLMQKMPFHKTFLLALFVVMGTTLFSCKNHNNDSLGGVSVVKDTIKTNATKDLILPPKESVKKENITVGDVKYDPNDTSQPPPPPPPPPKVDQVKFVNKKTHSKKYRQITTGEIILEEKTPTERLDLTKIKTK
jgi:hypothetical protein